MKALSVRAVVQSYIRRAGLTQKEVAQRLNIDETVLSRDLKQPEKLLPYLSKLYSILDLSEREQSELLVLLGVMPAPPDRQAPFMALDLDDYIPRAQEFEQLIGKLTGTRTGTTVAITAALQGAGGFGKTTLAQMICHDSRVRQAFPDGVLWVTLGKEPGNLIDKADELIRILTGSSSNAVSLQTVAVALREAIGQRTLLLVIDDVWESAHLLPFLQGGQHCARLITTRNRATLPHKAEQIDVDAMRPAEAVELLRTGLPAGDEEEFRMLAVRLGEWPLLLKLTNGQLRRRVNDPALKQSLPEALDYVNQAIHRHGPTAFDVRNQSDRTLAVRLTLEHSFELLTETDRLRYNELAIFPEDVDIPLATIAQLWEQTGRLDVIESEELCERLYQLSLLLHFSPTAGTIRLHDVIRSYLIQGQQAAMPSLHRSLLDAYRPVDYDVEEGAEGNRWAALTSDEEYMWRYLTYHLAAAQQIDELRTVLFDFAWLRAKLNMTDVGMLLGDFDMLTEDTDSRQVQEALRLSAHVLANDRAQLAGQLLGRLLSSESSTVQALLVQAHALQSTPWLCPLLSSLSSPGPLVRTLSGHRNEVWSVAISADGQQLISAADDRTLKVWDLARGTDTMTLRGKTDRMRAVAVTPDGRWAFSGSKDHAVRVWNLRTRKEDRRLLGHTDGIDSIAIIADKELIASASEDRTIITWHWPTGTQLYRLVGHTDRVYAVAASPDGQKLVSGSKDNTLKVWDVDTGTELMTFDGHKGGVWCVTFTLDGRQILSGSQDGTVKIWDLDARVEIASLAHQKSGVRSICILPDGQRMLTLTENGVLHIWDIQNRQCIATIPTHERAARAVVATPDGQLAITASADWTLRVWNLDLLATQSNNTVHQDAVRAVAISADGRCAVSASADKAIKVWNTLERRVEATLLGHTEWVNAIAISPDGHVAISGSNDKTIKVWNLEDSTLVQTLTGHNAAVTAVAMSADHHRAVSGSNDQTVIVWDLEKATIVFHVEGHAAKVRAVALSADGKWGLSGADKAVTLSEDRQKILRTSLTDILKSWRLGQDLSQQNLVDHTDGVVSVAITIDGRRAISAATDSSLKIWDIQKGSVLSTLKKGASNIRSVVFARSGTLAVSASADKVLAIWDLTTGQIISQFHTDSALNTCAISDDGEIVIAGDAEGNVHLFRYFT